MKDKFIRTATFSLTFLLGCEVITNTVPGSDAVLPKFGKENIQDISSESNQLQDEVPCKETGNKESQNVTPTDMNGKYCNKIGVGATIILHCGQHWVIYCWGSRDELANTLIIEAITSISSFERTHYNIPQSRCLSFMKKRRNHPFKFLGAQCP